MFSLLPVSSPSSQSDRPVYALDATPRWLAGIIFVLWMLNTVHISLPVFRDKLFHFYEIYPISAYPMFTTSNYDTAESYHFEVIPEPGMQPVPIASNRMFYPVPAQKMDIPILEAIFHNVEKSVQQGCPTYQTHSFFNCAVQPLADFSLPEDIRAMWVSSARHELNLTTDPYEIRLYTVHHTFAPENRNRSHQERIDLLTLHPRGAHIRVPERSAANE